MSKVYLNEISFNRDDLKDIKGCFVCGLTDGANEDGDESILLTFFNPNTVKHIQLKIGSHGHIFISTPFN